VRVGSALKADQVGKDKRSTFLLSQPIYAAVQ